MLRTNLATRRTFVRLRANKIKSEALILLSLSVLHLFSYPLKKELQKNLRFFTAPFRLFSCSGLFCCYVSGDFVEI